MTVVIQGAEVTAVSWDEGTVRSALADLLADGMSRKDAAAQVAKDSGWRRREVYKLSLES